MGGPNFLNFIPLTLNRRLNSFFQVGLEEENWNIARMTPQWSDMQNDAILDLGWHLTPHIQSSRPNSMFNLKFLTYLITSALFQTHRTIDIEAIPNDTASW